MGSLVTATDLSKNVVNRAKQVGGPDNVWIAKDLLEYPCHLEPAMKAMFGRVLVCRDLEVATNVAYDEDVMVYCVTLDGDEVDPSGEMSGGVGGDGGVLAFLND